MLVIPAIDILKGRVVRLKQGDYSQVTHYNDDPIELAIEFEKQGFTHLHLVDLDGAKAGMVIHDELIRKIKSATGLQIDFGGGVKTETDLLKVFESGAQQVNIGSMAVQNPTELKRWMKSYGAEHFILSADVKNEQVYINGWTQDGKKSIQDLILEYLPFGLETITCTDITKDGMMNGPSIELYRKLISDFQNLKVIASGGVSKIDDLLNLKASGCFAAVAGKSVLEGKITSAEITKMGLQI